MSWGGIWWWLCFHTCSPPGGSRWHSDSPTENQAGGRSPTLPHPAEASCNVFFLNTIFKTPEKFYPLHCSSFLKCWTPSVTIFFLYREIGSFIIYQCATGTDFPGELFLHLSRSWFPLHSCRIVLLDIRFGIASFKGFILFLFLILEWCGVASFWLPWFQRRNHYYSHCCFPVDNASFLFSLFQTYVFIFSSQSFIMMLLGR